MTNTFANFVVELVEERVRELIRKDYSNREILKKARCFPSLIDKIRKEEEEKIKEFKEAERKVVERITEPERWLE